MKTYAGSLQRRGNRYYLVIHADGHQRWFALKTDKLPLARMRAARIAPPDPNEKIAWLRQLVREGEKARAELLRQQAKADLTWDNLAARVATTLDVSTSADSQRCHAHWIALLARAAHPLRTGACPGNLAPEDAASALSDLAAKYRSSSRMLRFFVRAWAAVGLDHTIWPTHLPAAAANTHGEHYRRLSVDEVRAVHRTLTASHPDLADMVAIGYATGLRLSDVAELELSELALPLLRIVPNKTRGRKPNPLHIPLTDEVLAVITRRRLEAERMGNEFLFGETIRHRPSRKIAAAFRRAGVMKQGGDRASFHSLRATFISMMDEAGIPPHLTDTITGHGGGGMHARYTQPSDEALQRAVRQAIPPLALHPQQAPL